MRMGKVLACLARNEVIGELEGSCEKPGRRARSGEQAPTKHHTPNHIGPGYTMWRHFWGLVQGLGFRVYLMNQGSGIHG